MRKIITSLAAACALLGAADLSAAYGYIPHATTWRQMSEKASAVVKAKLVGIRDVALPEGTINADAMLYTRNNGDKTMRRMADIEVTRVLRPDSGGEITVGQMEIISLMQQKLEQYPASLQNHGEAVLFLEKSRPENLWNIACETRGILSSEDAKGDLVRAESAVAKVLDMNTELAPYPDLLNGSMQDFLLSEIKLDGSRMSHDAMLEFSSHFETLAAGFDDAEKAKLLELMNGTVAGSDERGDMIIAVGRMKPEGGMNAIVELIAADPARSTAALGSSALEMYSRAQGAKLLLDKYFALADENTVARARVITALGLLRPKDELPGEADSRVLFTDILRSTLKADSDALVLKESLLAARDMRYTENELGAKLVQLTKDFNAGTVDDTVYKRAIVALAATRNAYARKYLLSLKGEHGKRFDQHIDMALKMPFTVLVDFE